MESQRNGRSQVSKVGSELIRLSSSLVPNISSLGEDLLIEIFSRLGPGSKHVVQCKSVSKLWLSILRTSCFIRGWRQINRTEEHELPSILLTQYIHSFKNDPRVFDNFASNVPNLKGLSSFESFDFLGMEDIYILATYKDLVLCCPNIYDHSAYYLCNPFTKQWTALPPPPPTGFRNGLDDFVQVGLMVYDDNDDDCSFNFKILRIIPYPEDEVWKVEVFSSQDISAGWRVIDNADGWGDMFLFCCHFSICVPYNGMLVWLVQSWEEEPIAAKLTGFKLNPSVDANVDSTLLPTPPNFVADSPSAIIGLFQGKLRLAEWIDIDFNEDNDGMPFLVLKIWQLGSDCQWELLHEMNFRELEGSTGYLAARSCLLDQYWRRMTRILAFDPRDGDVLYLLFATSEREPVVEDSSFIFMCNVKQRTLEPIRKLPSMLYPCNSLRLLVPSWPTSDPLPPPSV